MGLGAVPSLKETGTSFKPRSTSTALGNEPLHFRLTGAVSQYFYVKGADDAADVWRCYFELAEKSFAVVR